MLGLLWVYGLRGFRVWRFRVARASISGFGGLKGSGSRV